MFDQSVSDFLGWVAREAPPAALTEGPGQLRSVRSRSGTWRRRWAPRTRLRDVAAWRGASLAGRIRRAVR